MLRARMLPLVGVMLALLAMTASVLPADKPAAGVPTDIPQHLQDVSVLVRANGASGSGVVSVTKDGVAWVWTAGHVVAHLKTSRDTDAGKKIVEFADASVVKMLVEKKIGREVGKVELAAEVIRYSDADHGEDLALLRLYGKEALPPLASVRFYLDKDIPGLDCPLFHVGSMLGELGASSLTRGNVSAIGRVLNGKLYDQSTCAALPGSSGGGIFLQSDGQYIGMVVRGNGPLILNVPVRRMLSYAKRVGVDFTMDPSIEPATEKDLKSKSIEE